MSWLMLLKPSAMPCECSSRPLMASTGPLDTPMSKNATMSWRRLLSVRPNWASFVVVLSLSVTSVSIRFAMVFLAPRLLDWS